MCVLLIINIILPSRLYILIIYERRYSTLLLLLRTKVRTNEGMNEDKKKLKKIDDFIRS